MKLPKCPVCQTRRWTKRIRNDYFRCTNCGSIWEHKGFTEQERAESLCPVCNIYVEYANWHPYYEYWGSSGKVKKFHYDCYSKYEAQLKEQREEFERGIERAEKISQIVCPNCKTKNICIMPEGWHDIIYWCVQCETSYSEEWINEQIKEITDVPIR